jgi:uncharacterized protein YgiM (DUF1202 family)
VEPEHPADEPLLADEPAAPRAGDLDDELDEEPLDERVEREIARRSARYQRWRRKRRRHLIAFWLLFLLLVVGGIAAAFALAGGSDEGSARAPTTTTAAGSDLPDIPPAKSYKVTDGVNIRSGPGTTYRAVGTVETGFEVLVICQIDGQAVNGPVGPSNKWLYVLSNGINGYVTAQYVAVGPAINDTTVIGECPPL